MKRLLCAAALVAVTRDAPAQELVYAGEPTHASEPSPPVDAFVQKRGYDVEIAAIGGYGTAPVHGAVNKLGAGFGGRIGLAFGGLYVGARIVDYLGGTDVDLSDSALLYGVEIGYGIRRRVLTLGAFTLRFQLGAGNAGFAHTDPSQRTADVVSSASGGRSRSDTTVVSALYVEPGVVAMLAWGNVFVATSANVFVVPTIAYAQEPSSTWVSYVAAAQVGLRF